MRTMFPLSSLLSLALLGACVDGGKADSGGDSGDSGQLLGDGGGGGGGGGGSAIDPLLDECVPVAATSEMGVLEGTLARPEVLEQTFVGPADRLKGVLTFTLAGPRSNDDAVDLGVSIDHIDIGIDDTEIEKGPDDGVAVLAAVSPGEAVTLRIAELNYREGAPESYAVAAEWLWVESDDCYEPNDVVADAKHVPTGVEHSAWMLPGLGPDPDLTDWYRFTIAEDSVVTLRITHPETIALGWALFAGDRDESGGPLAEEFFTDPAGSALWTSDGALPAGTYTLRLQPFVSAAEVDLPLAPTQPHLTGGYTFQVDLGG